MATGRLGTADLSAATNTTLYTVPSATFAVATVNLVNRTASAVTVRIALASSATPGNGEWIEYGVSLAANTVLERTGLVLDAGKSVVVYASASGVSAVAYGIETPTA